MRWAPQDEEVGVSLAGRFDRVEADYVLILRRSVAMRPSLEGRSTRVQTSSARHPGLPGADGVGSGSSLPMPDQSTLRVAKSRPDRTTKPMTEPASSARSSSRRMA